MTDNITYTFTQTIDSRIFGIFGINQELFGIIVTILLAVLISIMVYFYTGGILIAVISATAEIMVSGFLGFIPLWIVFLQVLCIVSTFLFFSISDSTKSQTVAQNTDAWVEYGNKLKTAYSAKFGGENTGFNDEIDYRIAIMQNLKHGFTHTIARDWLKRMERFTESK